VDVGGVMYGELMGRVMPIDERGKKNKSVSISIELFGVGR
jgi:hypothetical protein